MQWAHLPPRKKIMRTFLPFLSARDHGTPVVSGCEKGSAGNGVQVKGPSVVRSMRLMAVSSVPAALAGSACGAAQVPSAFQCATIGSSRRKTGRSRSAQRASGSSGR